MRPHLQTGRPPDGCFSGEEIVPKRKDALMPTAHISFPRIEFHLSATHKKAGGWAHSGQDNEDAVPTGADQFNPEDIEGFSIRST
jgi:hypothetical protein